MNGATDRDGRRTTALASLALVANAFIWGTSWWPFRWLHAHGVHPLWATSIVLSLGALAIAAARPRAVRQLVTTPALWLLFIAAGVTNSSFNWGVTIGDVVRVVLLFYLMPIWAVLLARALLGEPLTVASTLRVALALGGAAIVLWPADGGWPMPRTLAEALGLLGGFTFALNNVVLRREAHRPEEGRALAMFAGGALVSATMVIALTATGATTIAPLPPLAFGPAAVLAGLALAFLLGNLALQYGAARLPAQRTAVVMLTEVVFASASSVALGAGTLSWSLAIGGALICASAALAAVSSGSRMPGADPA